MMKFYVRGYAGRVFRLLMIGLLTLCATTQVVSAQFLFSNPTFRTEYAPFGALAIDVNGDGLADFVTVSNSYNAVVVLIGKGDATFRSRVEYDAGYGPTSVLAADLNGDGYPDLVVSRFGYISLLLNKGDGTFASKVDYDTGAAGNSAAIADFNGDGFPDIAVANYANLNGPYSNTVSIFNGNGDGSFGARVDFPFASGIKGLAAGDVNGDGKPDLLLTYPSPLNNYPPDVVRVLINQGGGAFAPGVDYTVGNGAGSAILADVNGDGKPDLLTMNSGDYQQNYKNSGISLLLNRGDGTFGPKTDYKTPPYCSGLLVADVTGDSLPDIVYANGSNALAILPGDGAGAFGAETDYSVGAAPNSIAVADYNGDGILDLITCNGGQDVTVLLGLGKGRYQNPVSLPAGNAPQAVALADVNGDGKADLIVLNNGSNTVSVAFGNGDGTFGAKSDYPVSGKPVALAVVDVNKDGKPDVLALCQQSSNVSVLLNQGNGTFGAKTDFSVLSTPQSFAVTDLDGDGNPDIVAMGAAQISLLYGNGKGRFSFINSIDVPVNSGPVAIGDVTGDGKSDIVFSLLSLYIGVLPNLGNRAFGARTDYRVPTGATCIALSDINNDGRLDIVFSPNASYGGIYVLINYGSGIFPQNNAAYYSVGAPIRQFQLIDMNSDGRLDVVTANHDSNSISVLLGNGDGTFGVTQPYSNQNVSSAQNYLTGNGPSALAVGDINGDGRPDVTTANTNGNNVTLLPNISGNYGAVSGTLTFEGFSARSYYSQNVLFLFRPVGGGATVTKLVSVNANGVFALSGVPKNRYQARVKGARTLAVTLPAMVTSDLSGLSAFLRVGDANGDNKVDVSDFEVLVNAYGSDTSANYLDYDIRADFNGDGLVDTTDFGLLVGNYGSVGAP